MSTFIVENQPKSPVSEAYRILRTNIQFSSFDNEVKSILITSSGTVEGKSTTAGNLALTMIQSGKSVILLDCDLRKPSIHKKFSISNKIGLSNYLIGEVDFEDVIVKYKDNLHVIPSGTIPPNPSEMISSNKMKSFIQRCKEEYDYVILDAPPVIAVTDAQILSTDVDGVLLVVAAEQSDKNAVIKAKELLENVKANIIGAVLTKVKNRYSYNYKGYYSQENSSVKGKKKRKIKK